MGMLNIRAEPTTLLLLMSDLDKSIHTLSPTDVSEVISSTTREMGKHNMLAPASEVLRHFIARMEQAIQDNDPETNTPEQLERLYTPVIRSIKWFHRQSTLPLPDAEGLHRHTDHLLTHLVGTLIRQIESMPTASRYSIKKLSHDILNLLFSKPYLQPELRKLLLVYTRNRNISLSSWMYWRCHLSALDEGDHKAAKRFRISANQRAKVEAKAGRDMSGRNNVTEDENWSSSVDYRNIGEMSSVRTSRRVQGVLDLVGNSLYDTTPSTSHAWSHLLNISRKDPSIELLTLSSLRDSIPPEQFTSHTLTPLMLGYLEKGDAEQAWQIWRDLVNRQSEANEVLVDRVALSVGTLSVYSLSGLDASIRLLDSWARRPSTTATQLSKGKIKKGDLNQSIVLDTQNVNVILKLCLQERKPSVALRVFTAALPRWGVYTDDISLTLLLDTCRFHNSAFRGPGKGRDGEYEHDIPDIRDRLRQLTDSLRFGRTSDTPKSTLETEQGYEAYDAAGFAKGSISVLLDPPGYVWRKEHSQPAWRKARDIFRDVLFTNWPFLAHTPSVLDFEKGPYAHLTRDLSSIFRFNKPRPLTSTTGTGSGQGQLRIPLPHSRKPYLHLIPSRNTFHSAIALLGYHNLPDEIPLVLAWMKELGIKPHKRTMLLALTHLGEVEGPRRVLANWEDGQSRLVRDTEVLRKWLIGWVGRGVPTEDDVADHRRKMLENNIRLSA